ncbi:T-cell immunoglobulin and mucin domain-containing protein 2-like isoform X2 [Mus pahari]|uniref:T-cell immunoglobulin and mucin domain-containing protein 2-like isoform X2 n=1 Tax=Mus pahari TaxID=10093 RepID=UPI0011148116|nr:T-cell immunoglobulin and mucin domain-containing protein 2-like isoform X2 [Mus pahari]
MNQLQVFISGLILLLPGPVDSYTAVQGLAGHPVTLPCIYSTHLGGIVPACWGLGECRYSYCIRSLIWTNGYKVTHQRNSRYQLKGNISEGNVSLTIENTVVSDGGPYCCVVEIPGAFYFVDYLLEVKPETSTIPPARPTTTRPTSTGRPTTTRPTSTGRPTTTKPTSTGRPRTTSTRSTHVPTPTRISTSTPPTPAHTQTHKPEPTTFCPHETTAEVTGTLSHTPAEATTFYPDRTTAEVTETLSYASADWNNTVTSSDESWNNNTEAIPLWKLQKNLTKGFYIGISIAALLIMMLLSTAVITRYMVMKKKPGSLSFCKIGASQNTVVELARGEDKVYIIEGTPYPEEES